MSKELFDLYLNNLNTSIELINVIIPTIKTFEGKVYNKRFENAINEVIESIQKDVRFYLNCDKIYLDYTYGYLTFWNRQITNEYRNVYILPKTRYINSDYRINASLIIKALEKQKAVIQKNINNLKAHALKVDEYRQSLEKIQKEAEKLNNSIPYEIRMFFDLKTFAIWR